MVRMMCRTHRTAVMVVLILYVNAGRGGRKPARPWRYAVAINPFNLMIALLST